MKSRPSAFGRHTSAGSSVTWSFTTRARAIVAVKCRWSLARTARPEAFSVYATTPLPLKASIPGPGGSVANSSASRGASRYFEPMKRTRGYVIRVTWWTGPRRRGEVPVGELEAEPLVLLGREELGLFDPPRA